MMDDKYENMADILRGILPVRKLQCFLLTLTLFCQLSTGDIVGCGGFLKSQVPIDFSKVDIRLYTKQGALKESSDCAPTNGYYFIPLYDKGEYILKIEPPIGWYFEPKEVNLNFDGATDPCSTQSDINFLFKGFAIFGKVISKGSDKGPENVKVKLTSKTDKSSVETTATASGGYFQFTPILPDKYLITVEHDAYKIIKNSVDVIVKDGNFEVPSNALVIAGYNVYGHVLSNGEPIKGVTLILYGTDEVTSKIKDVEGCSKMPLAEVKDNNFICHTSSDANGAFQFSSFPPGRYTIKPHYIKFDVQPQKMNVVVTHSHVQLNSQFVVKGFTVSGFVKLSKTGAGVDQAQIFLDGGLVTSTNKNGLYHLDNMDPGTYLLSVQADNMKFPEVTVKISPNTPEMDTMYPSEFKVCGRVVPIEDQPPSTRHVEARDLVRPDAAVIEVVTQWDTGDFCHYLPLGTYDLSVKISDFEKSKGLQYLPMSKRVIVQDRLVENIEFSQLRGELSGEIVRLVKNQEPKELTVILKSNRQVAAVKTLNGVESTYVFTDVMPGQYEVEVQSSDWCMEVPVHTITVSAAKTVVPRFVQSGYQMRVISSHACKVALTAGKEKSRVVDLQRGENVVCVARSVVYQVESADCHAYDQPSYKYSVGVDPPLRLTATTHLLTGTVVSKELVSNLVVDITNANGQKDRLGPIKGIKKPDNTFEYKFELRTKERQLLKFEPTSENIIFQPETAEYRTINDCADNVLVFTGEKGLIVEGAVTPPLGGAKITLHSEEGHELVFVTASNGRFRFGPLKNNAKYTMTAVKESYVLTGPDSSNNFQAHKLAEINVKVVDAASKEPLQGVLLSLTGGEKFRRNSATEAGGTLSFHSLSPGEYFLRPMMKEYKFEPASQIIQVREGATEHIQLRGRRVSFSVFGSITSLNGEPEPNILIEAVGLNTCSNLQEEGSSDQYGKFRVRGLLPQCDYIIRMKQGLQVNTHIHRVEPADLVVKTSQGDIKDVRLIAFELVEHTDMSVFVESTVPEHLKSLKLKLCKEDQPDAPVYSVRLDSVAGGVKHWGSAASQERFLRGGILVQIPFITRDRTPYLIQLESNLNKHTYTYKEPVMHFIADKSYRHIRMEFSAVPRVMDGELAQTSYLVVPALVACFVAYLCSHKLTPLALRLTDVIRMSAPDKASYVESSQGDAVSIEPVSLIGKRKTKPRKT